MSPSTDETPDPRRETSSAVFGTLALFFAVAVVALGFVESSGGLSVWLPRSWYTNRAMWYLLALAGFVLGWYLLKRSSAPPESNSRRRVGADIRFERVVLYTRTGCHLCEEVRHLLESYARFFPAIEERDIDTDPALVERFTDCVPVVEIDGKVRFRGRVNEVLLRRLIDATPPRRGSIP